LPFYNLPTYLFATKNIYFDTCKNLTNQNDQSNGPHSTNKKNHPNHNKHVEIDFVQNDEVVFSTPIQIGYFFIRFASQKNQFF
jgi:hypothetical protein